MSDTFPANTPVKLGDGREGVVVRKVQRTGFSGYVVRITKSVDEGQIGQTVGASPAAMRKLSQLNPKPVDQSAGLVEMAATMDMMPHGKRPPRKKLTPDLAALDSGTRSKVAKRWVKSERANARVKISSHEIVCDVAATPRQQASGLQAYDGLQSNQGLWFPQSARRVASFHMGEVKFPIDIIFVDQGKVAKIVSNVRPGQPGTWSQLCTDVVEVNGDWCRENEIGVGVVVRTPVHDKTAGDSYDPLRTITEAASEDSDLESEIREMFPHRFREAQENRQVKPRTFDMQPGDIDRRNPLERFKDRDLGDVRSPEGEDNPNTAFPGTFDPAHAEMQIGYDPTVFHELNGPAIRSGQRVDVQAPDANTALAGVDIKKLAQGSVQLFEKYAPKWESEQVGKDDTWNIAIVSDRLISSWIDSLGFDNTYEDTLRKVMFTNDYKRVLADALVKAGHAVRAEMLDSDLILYK